MSDGPPIVFLDVEDVIEIHQDQIDRYKGEAGILSMDLLESAVAMPVQGFFGEYAHSFPFGMAAAYLFHLARNHAFGDGNKRVAAATAVNFLLLNGFKMTAGEPIHSELVLRIVKGEATKEDAAAFYQSHSDATGD